MLSGWQEKSADGTTFGADHLAWLEKMRDYISASGSVDREHLEADNVLGPITAPSANAFGRSWKNSTSPSPRDFT